MKLYIFLIVLLMIALAGTCDYSDSRLVIKNNSEHSITFDYSIDTVMEERSNGNIAFFIRDKILAGETSIKTKPGSTKGWPFLIQKSVNKRLNVFIIDVDTLIKYNDWAYIKKNGLYKRYQFSEGELNSKKWVIEYP